jgi:L-fuconolactonase
MPTLDSQVHAYERNHPGRPWVGTLYGPAEVTGGQMVEAMDAVGVDGAILVSPFSMYRFLRDQISTDPADPAINRVLATAAQHSLPVNVACTGRLDQARQLAARNPNTRLVIDHLGLSQPHEPPAPAQPFADLPKLLALAAHDNVAVKVSGACTLAHESSPYRDIWDPLARVFDAFGFNRCMWGTDWTRAVGMLTYKQGVDAFRIADRLSQSDRAALMGETLMRIYNWPKAQA